MNDRLCLLASASALALTIMPSVAIAQQSASQQTPAEPAEPAVSAQDVPVDDGDIVVNAIRRSLESAQAVKQESNEIVDSVVAEDVGRLPDVTAAESLARIPGIQVTRNAGTAQGVTLRGLPDLATTYNGREVFTAEGRYVQLQDFPSNSIARIDVYKASSAGLLEPGLAGLIDVRSRRPFDFKGTRIIGAVTGVHWYQAQRIGLDTNGLFSTRWDTGIGEMGFLIEGSYADTKFYDGFRASAQDIRNRTNVPGYSQLRYPNFVNTEYNSGTRYRPNGAAVFQWRPTHGVEVYVDGLYQGYRAQNDAHNLQVVAGDLATLSNITLIEGTNQISSADAAAGTGAAPTGRYDINDQSTDTYQIGGGVVWKNGGSKVVADVAYTDSTFINRTFSFNYALASTPFRHFEFDSSQGVGGGAVTFPGYNLFNPANYRWTGLTQSGNRGHGDSIQARLDATQEVDRFGITGIDAGLRFSSRNAEANSYAPGVVSVTGTVLFSSLPLDFAAVQTGFRNDNVTDVTSWLAPTTASLVDNMDYLRNRLGIQSGDLPFGEPTYQSNEKIYTSYLQGRYAFDLGIPIDGQIGVRVTRADVSIDGFRRDNTGVVTPISEQRRTNDALPNVSLRAHLTDEVQLRLSFTKTRTRPGFGQLNPTITIGALPTICSTDPTNADCIRSASGGNSQLEPIRSTNYDASLEWYFSRSGSATVGVFRKDLTGFINTFTTDVTDAQFGRLRVSRPENGGDGRIEGVEAAARTFFRASWVPSFLQDFGALVNYTYLDAKTELSPGLAATLPGLQRIAGTSKHALNLSGFYERKALSLRVSYNYRSNYVSSYNQVVDPALGAGVLGPTLPITEKGRGTMDIAATLTPVQNITLTFNATNILGEAMQNSRQFNAAGQSYIWQTRFLESIYRVGVRFRF